MLTTRRSSELPALRRTGSPSISTRSEGCALKIMRGGSFPRGAFFALASAFAAATFASRRSRDMVLGSFGKCARRVPSQASALREVGKLARGIANRSTWTVRSSLFTCVRATIQTAPNVGWGEAGFSTDTAARQRRRSPSHFSRRGW